MSQVLIQQYLNQLQDLRKVSGTHRESVVREAFKDLLKGWARSRAFVLPTSGAGIVQPLPRVRIDHYRPNA
jgi:hypothetical protein